ncbi:MAG: hypothetical protein QM757_35145 [Paludibaculum sp.]
MLKLRDDLVDDVDRVCGVAVAPSLEPGCVELLLMLKGVWLTPAEFKVAATGREAVLLDRRLRELLSSLPFEVTIRERAEHLSLLARWCYSSWRDVDWIEFSKLEDLPYRRLVRSISRTAAAVQTTLFES